MVAHRAVHKKGWMHIQLCVGYYPDPNDARADMSDKKDPYACNGDLPDDFLEGEVKMRAVKVERMIHGEVWKLETR